jgi:hypothetical protein
MLIAGVSIAAQIVQTLVCRSVGVDRRALELCALCSIPSSVRIVYIKPMLPPRLLQMPVLFTRMATIRVSR